MARDMVLDFLLDLCDFVGFEDFQRLFADIRISWNEENHGISMLLFFPQSDWSKWPFTVIGPSS